MAEEKKSKGKTVANYLQKKKNTIKNIALGTIATGVVATGAGVMVDDMVDSMQSQTQEIPNSDYVGSTTNKNSQEALEELVDMSSFNEEISNLESQVEDAYNDRIEHQSQIDGYLKDNGYEIIKSAGRICNLEEKLKKHDDL